MTPSDLDAIGAFIDRYGLPLFTLLIGSVALWRGWLVIGWVFGYANTTKDKEIARLEAQLVEAKTELRASTDTERRLADALEEQNRLEADRIRIERERLDRATAHGQV